MKDKKPGNLAFGLIALLTDFGNKDYYAGVMKGIIKQINPAAEMIDITHEIPSYDLLSASFVVDRSYRFFPPGTIFLVIVDPGVGTERKLLLIEYSGYFFIGPDNGVFTPILEKAGNIYLLDNENYFLIKGHSTFEGRDKMAPAAAYLSLGVAPYEIGSLLQPNLYKQQLSFNPAYAPKLSPNGIEAQIVYIDKFGNTITNVNADFLFQALESSGFTKFKIIINNREIKTFYPTYGHAGSNKDEPFMLTGSHQNLEIAMNRQSAAATLNLKCGQKIFIEFYRGGI
ncbi:MAG: SAM-dependent chlorinase/fluorinase [Acidobacteria bacterium]|nr:SAM-dependent chlorinase/fluorinase [Acidobacteriota bacterium]